MSNFWMKNATSADLPTQQIDFGETKNKIKADLKVTGFNYDEQKKIKDKS